MKGHLVIPWKLVGNLQVLLLFDVISTETQVRIFVDSEPCQASFDKQGCLVYGNNRLIPSSTKELWEWLIGLRSGLITLEPNRVLLWSLEGNSWTDGKDTAWADEDEIDPTKLQTPGLLRMLPLMAMAMAMCQTRDAALLINTFAKEKNTLKGIQVFF